MLNYKEYKQLCVSMMAGIEAASAHSIESGLALNSHIAQEITSMSIEASGLHSRLQDIVSAKGYLGFLIMVSRFPDMFYVDRGFWLDYQLACYDLTHLILEGVDEDTIRLTKATPEYIMLSLFIDNPSTVIKRV